jgi:hypothetical protein
MRRRIRLALLVSLGLASAAEALTVRAVSVDELTARAAHIVRAHCVAVTPVASPENLPVVEIALAVAETLKGEARERLVIRQLAGRWSHLVPTCRIGDEVVLFLHAPSPVGLTSPVGLSQGFFRVERSPGRPARLLGDARIIGALSPAATAPLDATLDVLRARLAVSP